jgi:hypothetical protein
MQRLRFAVIYASHKDQHEGADVWLMSRAGLFVVSQMWI